MLRLQFLDHYKLLDITEEASQAEIERAYTAAVDALPRRPLDRFLAGLAGRTLDGYRIAYEELTDAKKRAEYDRYLEQGRKMFVSILH